jgi:hypothetical protein
MEVTLWAFVLYWTQILCTTMYGSTHTNKPLRDVGLSAFDQFTYQVDLCESSLDSFLPFLSWTSYWGILFSLLLNVFFASCIYGGQVSQYLAKESRVSSSQAIYKVSPSWISWQCLPGCCGYAFIAWSFWVSFLLDIFQCQVNLRLQSSTFGSFFSGFC